MSFVEQLRRLQHDHVGTSAMLEEIERVFRRWNHAELDDRAASAELSESLVALRDHVIDHFASEEEVLSPLAPHSSLELRRAIEALEAEHAAICALAVRLGDWAECAEATGPAELRRARENFAELRERFARHDPDEQALIASLLAAVVDSGASVARRS
jgi:hypothetical protein